jgi:peptide deformylase
MIRKAVQIGNPIVRKKSKQVNPKDIKSKKIQNLIKDLVDSMRHYGLVGMAAPQIGINLNVFVSEIRKTKLRTNSKILDGLRVLINPKIISKSKKQEDMYEGCGSVDFGKLHGPVKRHVAVTVQALNEKGEKFTLETKDLLAEIMQHEYDHLQGVLCIDKFTDTRKITHIDER